MPIRPGELADAPDACPAHLGPNLIDQGIAEGAARGIAVCVSHTPEDDTT